jgi:hypothetical protein
MANAAVDVGHVQGGAEANALLNAENQWDCHGALASCLRNSRVRTLRAIFCRNLPWRALSPLRTDTSLEQSWNDLPNRCNGARTHQILPRKVGALNHDRGSPPSLEWKTDPLTIYNSRSIVDHLKLWASQNDLVQALWIF